MRWRRAIVAVVVGTVVFVATYQFLEVQIFQTVQELTTHIWTVTPAFGWARTNWTITSALLVMPALVVTVFIYATGRPFTDTETRCRHCSHILKGLTEPRCPECGERI